MRERVVVKGSHFPRSSLSLSLAALWGSFPLLVGKKLHMPFTQMARCEARTTTLQVHNT